jgi:hypothetical protein
MLDPSLADTVICKLIALKDAGFFALSKVMVCWVFDAVAYNPENMTS